MSTTLGERNDSSADTKAGEGGEWGDAPVNRTDISHAAYGLHAAHVGFRDGADGCPKETVTPGEVNTGAGFYQDLWSHGERSPCWSRFAVRTHDPVGDPQCSCLFLKDLMEANSVGAVCEPHPMGGTQVGEQDCLLLEGWEDTKVLSTFFALVCNS